MGPALSRLEESVAGSAAFSFLLPTRIHTLPRRTLSPPRRRHPPPRSNLSPHLITMYSLRSLKELIPSPLGLSPPPFGLSLSKALSSSPCILSPSKAVP